jgi:hypothetical protein
VYANNGSLYVNLTSGDNSFDNLFYFNFDIEPFLTTNYSTKFETIKTNWYFEGTTLFHFVDNSELTFELPEDEYRIAHTHSRQLPDYKYFDGFGMEIEHDVSEYGTSEDYTTQIVLSPITFYNVPLLVPAIESWGFMDMIVALIILITPSVSFRELIDESTFIPMFTLMSVLAYATEIIPLWIFFTILIGIGTFAISKKSRGDMFIW